MNATKLLGKGLQRVMGAIVRSAGGQRILDYADRPVLAAALTRMCVDREFLECYCSEMKALYEDAMIGPALDTALKMYIQHHGFWNRDVLGNQIIARLALNVPALYNLHDFINNGPKSLDQQVQEAFDSKDIANALPRVFVMTPLDRSIVDVLLGV